MKHFTKNILFYSYVALISLHFSSTTLQATDSYQLLARQETYNQGCRFMNEGSQNTCKSPLPNAETLNRILTPTKPENEFIKRFLNISNIASLFANQKFSKKSIDQKVSETVQRYNPRFATSYADNLILTNDQYEKLCKLIPNMAARIHQSRNTSKK